MNGRKGLVEAACRSTGVADVIRQTLGLCYDLRLLSLCPLVRVIARRGLALVRLLDQVGRADLHRAALLDSH